MKNPRKKTNKQNIIRSVIKACQSGRRRFQKETVWSFVEDINLTVEEGKRSVIDVILLWLLFSYWRGVKQELEIEYKGDEPNNSEASEIIR